MIFMMNKALRLHQLEMPTSRRAPSTTTTTRTRVDSSKAVQVPAKPRRTEEEEGSISSTISVDGYNNKLKNDGGLELDASDHSISTASSLSSACSPTLPAPTVLSPAASTCSMRRRGKKVSFVLNKNQVYESTKTYEEVKRHCWFMALDYKRFKAYSVAMAREISKADQRSFQMSYTRVLERTYQACCRSSSNDEPVLSDEEKEQLVRWLGIAPSRLGLEHRAIALIAQQRQALKRHMFDTITNLKNGASPDVIRQVAESISRPSRLFAQTLAQAQEQADVVIVQQAYKYCMAEC